MTTKEGCDLDRREEDSTGDQTVWGRGRGEGEDRVKDSSGFLQLETAGGHHSLKSGAGREQKRAPSGLKFKSQQPIQPDSLNSKSEMYPGL